MPLFQNTGVHKYLNSQDSLKLSEKWELYKPYFLNSTFQENIRNSKETPKIAEQGDYFLTEKETTLEIQNQIMTTDKEIDAMVYELYGLSEEKIAIVENS